MKIGEFWDTEEEGFTPGFLWPEIPELCPDPLFLPPAANLELVVFLLLCCVPASGTISPGLLTPSGFTFVGADTADTTDTADTAGPNNSL